MKHLPLLSRTPRKQVVLDWLVAVALAAVGLADLYAMRFIDPLWLGSVVTLATFLPLGLRRSYPLATLTAVIVGSLVLIFVLQDPGTTGEYTFEVFLSWLLVSYSTAAHTSGRRYLIGVTIALTSALVWVGVALPAGRDPGNVVPRWRLLVDELAERTDELEREREHRAAAAVAEERGRIARELHDVVAHNVSVMVVQAQAGPLLLGAPERASAAFRAIEATGKDALLELRRLLGILRTESPDLVIGPQPGLEAVADLAAHVRAAGLPTKVHIEGEPVPLPAGVDLAAYRIVQEALTNALRHAGRPARARITVRYRPASLEVEIVDDGNGATANGSTSGNGLIGMRERATLYGGTLYAGRSEEGGYAVRAVLPLNGAVA
jgi:signal transduction histidine kinase